MEDVNKRRRISFSLSKLECGPQEIISREIRLHLPFSANWENATKIEKTGIHFKTDVFAAVAVVDAKAPYYYLDRLLTRTVLMNNRVRVKKKIEKTERQLRINLLLMVTLMLKRR